MGANCCLDCEDRGRAPYPVTQSVVLEIEEERLSTQLLLEEIIPRLRPKFTFSLHNEFCVGKHSCPPSPGVRKYPTTGTQVQRTSLTSH
jgi:hypothetical protein